MSVWKFGNYVPSFPNSPLIGNDGSQINFAGGDVGWPTQIGTTNTFFISFGDSYFSPAGSFVRRDDGTGILGNIVGIATCANNTFTVKYYQGGTAKTPAAFFTDKYDLDNDTRMSCLKSFMYNGKLYINLYRKKQQTGEAVGSVIVRIDNPLSTPQAWKKSYLTLTTAGQRLGVGDFGNEAFVLGSNLVIYGALAGKVIAVYLPVSLLETTPDGGNLFTMANGVNYLNTAGIWKSGFQGLDFWDVKIPTTAGFSIRYNSGIKKWQTIFTNTFIHLYGGFPPYASIMVADGPFGPWSEERILGYFPEMTETCGLYNADKVTYGVVERTDFCADPFNYVTVVYTVGSRSAMFLNNFAYQEQDQTVYRPTSYTFKNPFIK